MKKIWMYLLSVPLLSFGVHWLIGLLFDLGFSDMGGLLIMGMLLFGWPVSSVWLGLASGKNLKKLWFLPMLFALTMPFVFPYYKAGVYAWLYAGVIFAVGLIAMIGTWWDYREKPAS